ncbi:hypothetical protein HCU66_24485, partial [Pseudomonas frederiksbergensis]|nr:hypothetical protein [Pseudomonas frederiksbergensis]
MQLPASASNAPSDPKASPSYALQYQGLLDDYDLLLSFLRGTEKPSGTLANTLMRPRPFSPLDLDSQDGQSALQALIKDDDYRALCRRQNASYGSLTITMKDEQAVYQTLDLDRTTTITLSLIDNPKWATWTSRINKAAQKLGGQIRSDGLFSIARMAGYYGMTPWDPEDAAEHRAAIYALEEKRARHSLQLDSGVDIGSLTSAPTAEETTGVRINEAVRQFLPITETSLIGYLAKNLSSETTATQIREKPTVFLEKILRSDDAIRLAQALLEKLDWYGAKADEEASPFVQNKLLSRAIRLWERREKDNPKDIAGYPWYQRSNYGKSYEAIWSEFENHLLSSERASSEAEAILLASLYRSEFPSDFHRSDIPSDLPYRSSPVWVNFVHGLNLAEAIEPDRVPRMTFQQLVDFPLQESKGATAQELKLIAWCRIPPAVDWAIANGIVLEDKLSFYTDEVQGRAKLSFYTDEVQGRALEALDKHTGALKAAIVQMDVDIPKRPDIADKEIKNYFGPTALTSDGRKLIRDHGPDTGSRQLPSLKDKSVSLRDVYMWKKHKGKDWIITTPDGKSRSTNYLTINPSGYVSTLDPRILYHLRARKLPDVNQLFESEYTTYLRSTKTAYQTLLTGLFSFLPHDDRQAIEYGETKIYTLRASTKSIEL